MHSPKFWAAGSRTVWPPLLSPAAWAYDVAGQIKRGFTTTAEVPIPVACVGNIVAGGAGKTPTAIALAQIFGELGAKAHFLTRGYGGRARGPLRVDVETHDARWVGDEPLLLAEQAPTWVARNRPAGARAAHAAGAELIIMDDGFQNPSLKKDLSLVVIDGGYGFGNGHQIPAGPLREPIARGLRRAKAIVLIGEDTAGALEALPPDHPPVLQAQLLPGMEAYEIRERPVVAFAGIGRPQKFFDSLTEIGCELRAGFAFPDHHPYTPDEIMPLIERAAQVEATVVTTAKDYVRLPEEARPMVRVLHVFLEWQDADAVRALCAPLLSKFTRR